MQIYHEMVSAECIGKMQSLHPSQSPVTEHLSSFMFHTSIDASYPVIVARYSAVSCLPFRPGMHDKEDVKDRHMKP